MNGNRPMEAYYDGGGYPYTMSMSMSMNEGYMGLFDSHGHAHATTAIHPPVNYVYPAAPMQLHQETAYWSMNMHSYRSYYSDGASHSYYGYETNDPLPSTESNRRTWECSSSSMHVEEPTMFMQSEENVVTSSDGAEECPIDHQDATSPDPEVVWQDDVDPDNMTYEELLDLGETVGTQSRGLSEELIKLLPTSRYKAGGFFSRKKSRERCIICLVTYKIGDQQITLPCKHVYHSKCGRKWLSINKTCPVCNCEVFGDEPRN